MLTFHDDFFLSNPNAVSSMGDCLGQMAAKTLLRAISHHYIRRDRRNKPSRLQFTDFHASNIFVDKDGNIKCLIDLEWVCALPAEMLRVPYWLTGCAIDEITEENLREFEKVHQEFMNIFEEEEVKMTPTNPPALTSIIHDGWKSGAMWFWHCITSVNAMYFLVDDHISPRFSPLTIKAEEILSQYWCPGSTKAAERQINNREDYVKRVQFLLNDEAGLSGKKET
jgi:hypothetical protein